MPFKDKLKNREYQRAWWWKNHEERLASGRKQKQKYREQGRCASCGVKLIEGEKIRCQNCNSRVFRREMRYAKDSMRLAKEF